MTVPDPHDAASRRAPATRRARRERRERALLSPDDGLPTTQPLPVVSAATHPPIFKPPPPPPGTHRPLRAAGPVVLLPSHVASAPPLLHAGEHEPQHARRRTALAARIALAAASLVAVTTATGAAFAIHGALSTPPRTALSTVSVTAAAPPAPPRPTPDVDRIAPPAASSKSMAAPSVPRVDGMTASLALCATPAFTTALAGGDDAAAIAAAGGAAGFRTAVADGLAPCVPLHDPAHVWAVIDKQHPAQPLNYAPAHRARPAGVTNLDGSGLRVDAAAALDRMAQAMRVAGAGQIGLNSGFRSLQEQKRNYSAQLLDRGRAGADLVSARPGYSEHQTGLAADVVPCRAVCGALDGLAGSPQGAWIVAHAWQYGWIVRYETGQTPVTGYTSEPWHLRYIGPELAAAYHDGGFRSLEAFFGLPPAPDYAH